MIFLDLFLSFFKIGAFTFGGGYAMLPLIEKEVAAHGWMTTEQLVNFVAVSESTPGPFAVNIATYIGSEMGGQFAPIPDWLGSFFGSVCATFGVVLPSLIIILIIAKCYLAFKNSKVVKGCMTGLRPVTVGLIGAAVLTIGQSVFFAQGLSLLPLKTAAFWCSAVLCAASAVMGFKKIHPIIIICISAVVGIGLGYLGVWG